MGLKSSKVKLNKQEVGEYKTFKRVTWTNSNHLRLYNYYLKPLHDAKYTKHLQETHLQTLQIQTHDTTF